jgi:iron(III) transport system substrate-binding protein
MTRPASGPAGSTGIFGFIASNDRLTKEMSGKKPATWDDLLDPAWKGKLILPSPTLTGGGYIFIATQIFRFNKDEAKAMAYMKTLHGNIADYIGTSPGAIGAVSQGQYVGCPNWAHDILTEKGKNPGVSLAVPANTGFEVGGISIVRVRTTRSRGVRRSSTPEAGALNVKLSNCGSTLASVAPAPAPRLRASVSLVNYDRQWATDNRPGS